MTRDEKATIMAKAMMEKAKTIKWTAHKMEDAYKELALAALDAVEPLDSASTPA